MSHFTINSNVTRPWVKEVWKIVCNETSFESFRICVIDTAGKEESKHDLYAEAIVNALTILELEQKDR